ncbi:hypothetical protein N2K17_01580 [Klebsiella michiganensis]|uniref:hypothetical protein n=1 Tax=Klebsiella michiganensis TaxID=1134687 RepID=UPI002251B662|nr:hypothetical protein [Klebsiella michiganensis]MCX3078433.1 hypothetical protein [Klebsiella michiganensis]MCY0817724.1 hypothetical protein [Klebsiella michiganensis]
MTSKLKKRRNRRLRDDAAWYKAEAMDWQKIAFEHADEISELSYINSPAGVHHEQRYPTSHRLSQAGF